MTRKNKNISNYHYRSEKISEGQKIVKYYFTLKEICEEFNTSSFTIYRMMKGENEKWKPRNKLLRDIKFYKDIQPAKIFIPNEIGGVECA